jgi:hypothetical protein
MKMKLFNEEQILDSEFRKKVIDEIQGSENKNRKMSMLKRHEVYRDNTLKWVIEALTKEGLKSTTLQIMKNRAANISIAKKVVNKLARCYVGGVRREVEPASEQDKVDTLARLMSWDTKMKKADRYRQLFKNTQPQVIPEYSTQFSTPEQPKYKLKLRVLAPWQYDVIEDCYDREVPRVLILSDFVNRNVMANSLVAGSDGRQAQSEGDGRDQTIADSPQDAGKDQLCYIWWSNKYHLTTDDKGQIIPELTPEGDVPLNPIEVMPSVNVAEDQDGEFWALGGDDLIDGAILVNTVITDMLAIAFIQGWAQMVVTAKKVPKTLEGGPHNALIFEYETGDPVPDVKFVSAQPPLDVWMQTVEQYVALLLSTNDLSPTSIANKIDANQFPSGIALLIEQSEATSSIEDKQKIFQDAERKLWDIVARWQNLYFEAGALEPDFEQVGKVGEIDVSLKFTQSKPAMTEKEKLDNLKVRKDLGINTMVDLIMIDNPDLTEEEATTKLTQIMEERVKRIADAMTQSLKVQGSGPQTPPAAKPPVDPMASGAVPN